MKTTKCIVCEKKFDLNVAISKHDVFFCSEECVVMYEKKLEDIKKIVNWDNCC
ncbi:MAG: hypothetical protein V1928_04905 [Parcubacteria group bacterium]